MGKMQSHKLMIEGMGSLMDMYPEIRTEDLIVTDPEERMRNTWERVGRSMWQALDGYKATVSEK